jgi:hypothetical protein
MDEKTQRVIKADNVKIDGQVLLGLNSATGSPKSAAASSPDLNAPGAFIVEKNPQFMIVEITCTCGKKTYLRCEFA